MDKSWITSPKFSSIYTKGVADFMVFVREHLGRDRDSESSEITILDEVVDREVEELLTRADIDEGEDVYVDSVVEEEEDMAEDEYNEEDDTLNEYDDDDKEEEEQGDDEDSDDDYGL